MKRFTNKLTLFVTLVVILACCLCACENVPTETSTFQIVYVDGANVDVATVPAGQTVTLKTLTDTADKHFDGWYTSATFDGEPITEITTTDGGSILLYASWTELIEPGRYYAVTFDANGGTGAMQALIFAGETAILPLCAFTRQGYSFEGWATSKDGNVVYTDGATFTRDGMNEKTLYAVWEDGQIVPPITRYCTITFNTDGGTPISPMTVEVGATVTAPTSPTKSGYTFKGWNPALPTTMPDHDVTVTAIWEQNAPVTYTVTFNANGGSGVMQNLVFENESAVLPTCTFIRAGYTFKGWATSPSGSVVYTDGATFTRDSATSKTLYAVWEQNQTDVTALVNALQKFNDGNFKFDYIYSDTGTAYDALHSYTNTNWYYNGNYKVTYYYMDSYYTDYLMRNCCGYKLAYFYDFGFEYYLIGDTDLYFESTYLDYAYFDYVYPQKLASSGFVQDGASYKVTGTALNEQGARLMFGESYNAFFHSDYTFTELTLTPNGDTITIDVKYDVTGEVDYSVSVKMVFSEFGAVSFSAPTNYTDYTYTGEATDIADLTTGDVVTSGTVFAIVGNNFYIVNKSGTAGVYVYMGSDSPNCNVGDEVTVEGEYTIYSGLPEITGPTVTVNSSNNTFNTITLDSVKDADDYVSMPLTITGLKVKSLPTSWTSTNDIQVTVTDNAGNQIVFFISKHLDSSAKTNIINYLKTLKVGDAFKAENVTISVFKDNPQIAVTESTKLGAGWQEGDPVVLTGIKTSATTLSVEYGTTLANAVKDVTVSLCYNNGTTALATEGVSYTCASYSATTPGSYNVVFSCQGKTATVVVTVKAEPQETFKLKDGEAETLYDVIEKTEFTYQGEEYFLTHGMPSRGDVKVLVIPVTFTDAPAPKNMVENLEIAFFGTTAETGWQSLASYYKTSSYGKLNITGTVLEPFATGNSTSYYDRIYKQTEDADYKIIKAALDYYDSQIDFSDYDSDGDGYIDALYIIYSADVNYTDNDSMWWAYTYEYYTDEYEIHDGVEPDFYFFAGYDFIFEELRNGKSVDYNAETFVHETGHMMGLNDYYDYDEDKGPDGGIGGGDMMDYNVGDHNAFSKAILGWVNPWVVSGCDTTLTLSSFGASGDCIIIAKEWNGTFFDEYFIVDFYTPDGLNAIEAGDSGLFSVSGVRIYHVDAVLKDDAGASYEVCYYDNSYTAHKQIALVEADNDNSVEKSRDHLGENDDLFQAGDSFTWGKWYDGSSAGFTLTVTKIENGQATITIDY